jgi:hypothetical protein
LDEYAEGKIVEYLTDPRYDDVRRARAAADDTSEALSAARAEVKAIEAELRGLYAQVEAGDVSPTIATKAERGLLDRKKDAEAQVKTLAKPSDLDRLFPSGTEWQTMPMSAKREVARRVLSVDLLGELRVMRAGPRRRVPAAERVRLIRHKRVEVA